MRKKYTRWYMNNEDKVRRSFILCVIHFLLFSPSVYYGDDDGYNEWLNSPP